MLAANLNDSVSDLFNGCDLDGVLSCAPIVDQASNFTIGQMYHVLDLGTHSPVEFKDRLMQGLPPSVQTQVNDLFNSY